MGICGTQYANAMTVYFLMGIIPVTALIFFIIEIIIGKKRNKKIKPFVISASVSALLAAFPVTAFVIMLLEPPEAEVWEKMVDLTGYDYNESKAVYSEYFELDIEYELYSDEYPKGAIISQSPPAETRIPRGQKVWCTVSKGVQILSVCNVIAIDIETAKKIVNSAGFEYEIKYEYSDEYEKGIVFASEPERNTEVPKGSTITLYVSNGKE
ncbi:MAG: PASTA domain-containing protein [Oscillospiraceae bacterium]|nr:PASTA domain-containing protein [Oscillospiraceae bacterium]